MLPNSKIQKTLTAVVALSAAALSSFPLMAEGKSASAPIPLDQLDLPESVLQQLRDQLTAPKGAPGIAFGSPVAFGAGWGELYVGLGGETIEDKDQRVDGSLALGFGLGNANKSIGLDTTVALISLKEGLDNDGNVSFKLHALLPNQSAFAIGLENTARWGAAKRTSSSIYAVYSKLWAPTLFGKARPVATSVGVGSQRFVDVDSLGNKEGLGVFASTALQVNRGVSTILDWTGVDLNAGVSVVPFRTIPVTITAGAINLTENNSRDVEFSFGVGYSYNFNR
jgi:hypothetical protein